MAKHLSSIFSFDTVSFDRERWRCFLIVMGIALCVFGTVETVARNVLGRFGGRWEYWAGGAAEKFETYFADIVPQDRVDVLVVGDSTAEADYEPAAIVDAPLKSWNIGTSGNFALAFEQSTLPRIFDNGQHLPRVLIASFIPTAFFNGNTPVASEMAIINSPVCRRRRTGWLLSDYVWIARVFPCIQYVKAEMAGVVKETRANRGFEPLVGCRLGQVRRRAKNKLEVYQTIINERRLKVLNDLAAKAARHDVTLVLVVPPTRDRSMRRLQLDNIYVQRLRETLNREDVVLLDYRDFGEDSLFHDLNHLNVKGAEILSKKLRSELKQRGLIQQAPNTESGERG